jgi:crotonobetainyl-CoA:carnitine CoA-transferase CaiB-like acyl-CoA transferase
MARKIQQTSPTKHNINLHKTLLQLVGQYTLENDTAVLSQPARTTSWQKVRPVLADDNRSNQTSSHKGTLKRRSVAASPIKYLSFLLQQVRMNLKMMGMTISGCQTIRTVGKYWDDTASPLPGSD